VVVKNQRFTKLEIYNFSVPSSFELSGRDLVHTSATMLRATHARSAPAANKIWPLACPEASRGSRKAMGFTSAETGTVFGTVSLRNLEPLAILAKKL
jgi:hypothetical protein